MALWHSALAILIKMSVIYRIVNAQGVSVYTHAPLLPLLNAYQYRKSITTIVQCKVYTHTCTLLQLYSKCPNLMNSPDRILGDDHIGIDEFTVELEASIVIAEALISN